MTTIEKQDKSNLLVEKDQNKQSVALPPKKVFASKLAAQQQQQQQQIVSPTNSESLSTKRRLSSSVENNNKKAKPTKSITHSERIVQAEIAQYRPCKDYKEIDVVYTKLLFFL